MPIEELVRVGEVLPIVRWGEPVMHTPTREILVQLKSDRRTTHQLSLDVRRQHGAPDSVRGQVDPVTTAFHEVGPLPPRHSRVEVVAQEIESGAVEFIRCGESVGLIGEVEWSENEWHKSTLFVSITALSAPDR